MTHRDFYEWGQLMLENLMESSQRVYILVYNLLYVFSFLIFFS